MNIKDYQEQSKRTLPELGTITMNSIHMVLGMVTESAELADVYKKKIAYGKSVDEVNVKEELGDCLWYIANMCNINNWDMEDILETNINKLKVRYPEKFTNEAALNRDLGAERNELEK